MKHFDLQLKEFSQQFTEQVKCLESKVSVDSSILSNILELYKRRSAIEQSYAENLSKLSASITQRNNFESIKRPNWKKYSPTKMLHSLLASTEHTARAHKQLGDIYGKQMTQRIMDMQDDCSRLTKRSTEILQHRHLDFLQSMNKLSVKHKNYTKLFNDADDYRRKADRVLDQLDREVVRCHGKKKEVDKNFKIKKLKEEYMEKLKILKEKYAECTNARNKYIIHLGSLNDALSHFYTNELRTIIQCSQYGFHNNLTRVAMNHNSCEEALSTIHRSIRDLFSSTIDNIDVSNDMDVFVQAHQCVLLPKEQFRFNFVKDDNVDHVQKIEMKVANHLKDIHTKFDTRFQKISTDLRNEEEQISMITNQFNELISQTDYDVVDYVCHDRKLENNIKDRPQTIRKDSVCDTLYASIQKKIKEPKLQVEINYFKLMEKYLDDQITLVNVRNKLKSVERVLNGPMNSPESFYTKRVDLHRQTAVMVGIKSKLFGGDLKRYSKETNEVVPFVVVSCIRLINLYGLNNVGVFRVPGSQFDVQNHKSQLDLGSDPIKQLSGSTNDVNLAASLLKLYFRELDPPLFDEFMFAEIVKKYDDMKNDEQTIVDYMRDFVLQLHPAVYATMTYLLAFLDHLSEFSATNCMEISNLAIIFGPCLMPIPEDKSSQLFHFQAIVNHITQTLITHRKEIFIKPSTGPQYQRDQSLVEPLSADDPNADLFFDQNSISSIEERRSRNTSTTSSINLYSRSEDETLTQVDESFTLKEPPSASWRLKDILQPDADKYSSLIVNSTAGLSQVTDDITANENALYSPRKDSDVSSVGGQEGTEKRWMPKNLSFPSDLNDLDIRSRCDTQESLLLDIPLEFADTTEPKSANSIESIAFMDGTEQSMVGGSTTDNDSGDKVENSDVIIRKDSRALSTSEAMDTVDDELIQMRRGLEKIEELHVTNHRNTIHFDNARLASKFMNPLCSDRMSVLGSGVSTVAAEIGGAPSPDSLGSSDSANTNTTMTSVVPLTTTRIHQRSPLYESSVSLDDSRNATPPPVPKRFA